MFGSGRFQVIESIPAGDGVDFVRARDDLSGAVVAVKARSAPFPRPEERAALKREHGLLASLRVGGIPRPIAFLDDPAYPALVMEDIPGSPLDSCFAAVPCGPDAFFSLARGAAGIVLRIHERSVVHKRIRPSNIFFDERTRSITLVDFSEASVLPRERMGSGSSGSGDSGAFCPPELRGAVDRPVDARADLYSLGATLYFVLCGRPPFPAGEGHAAGARPVPPSALRDDIPPAADAVILKLLEFEPFDRYRSARGLLSDLEEIDELRHADRGEGLPAAFRAGKADSYASCVLPDRLYGRDEEMAILEAAAEESRGGSSRSILLAGNSGVGKSALAASFLARAETRGWLAGKGKFDQLARGAPLAAFGAALDGLVARIPEEGRARAAAAARDACGQNAALVAEVSRGAAALLGENAPTGELPARERLNRLLHTVSRFVGAVASSGPPAALFLDDLQWAEPLALDLFLHLAEDPSLRGVLLIGAQREGTPADRVREAKGLRTIRMRGLRAEDVRAMVADALGCSDDGLADELMERSDGNPLFFKRLFSDLVDRRAIKWDEASRRWDCEDAVPALAAVADDMAEYLLSEFASLPRETRRVMAAAACAGFRFDLAEVAHAVEAPLYVAAKVLETPIRRELLIPESADYRILDTLGPGDPEPEGLPLPFRFAHDRLQLAASQGASPSERASFHVRFALRLAGLGRDGKRDGPAVPENAAAEIARHLNEGTAAPEIAALGDLVFEANAKAARRARDEAAFESAYEFLSIAEARRPRLSPAESLALDRDLAEACYLTGRLAEAEERVEALLAGARDDRERAETLRFKASQLLSVGAMDAALDAGLDALELLGVKLAAAPSRRRVVLEFMLLSARLRMRDTAALAELPPIGPCREAVAASIITELGPAAYLSGRETLFAAFAAKAVGLTLGKGTSPDIAVQWLGYALVMNGAGGRLDEGTRFGEIGKAIMDGSRDRRYESRVLFLYAIFVRHWNAHRSELAPLLKAAFRSALEEGNLLYASFAATHVHQWNPGWTLGEAIAEGERSLAFLDSARNRDAWDSTKVAHQLRKAQAGLTLAPDSLSDDEFDADSCLARMEAGGYTTGVAAYEITMLELLCSQGSWTAAFAFALKARGKLDALAGQPWIPDFWIWAAVAAGSRLSGYPEGISGGGSREASAARSLLREAARLLASWARRCPENFFATSRIAAAEIHGARANLSLRNGAGRGTGGSPRPGPGPAEAAAFRAVILYEEAAEAARIHGYPGTEALACERAGLLCRSTGNSRAARAYFDAAAAAQRRRGAVAVARRLEALARESDSPSGSSAARR